MTDIDAGLDPVLTADGLCFGCGPRNPVGLCLSFFWDGDDCCADWTPTREHQGWAGRAHGGLLATVLDEALSHAALERHGLFWVTAELTARLRRPAVIGDPLRVSARIVAVRPRLILCEGEVRTHPAGVLVASGRAKMMRA